jgi:uncharacterized protein
MQLSRFVVVYEAVRPGEHVLYDVLGDRYAGVETAVLEAARRWSAGAPPDGADEAEAQRVLRNQGLLVESAAEDDQRLRENLETAREGIPGTLFVTVQPTLACNLACTYCFQKESPAFTKMSEATLQATVEWIVQTVDARAIRTLHIHWFGGEPLTRKAQVLSATAALSAAMAARAGRFEWSMTTNGIGLDAPFAEAMRRCGEGSIKLTMDGDRETHDQARVYRDGRGSFDEVFAAALAVAPIVRLRIGGNFLPGQAASYERLLERLDAAGLTPLLEAVRFKPVVETQRKSGACTGCSDGKEEAQTLVQLNRSIEKRRLGQHQGETLEGMLGPCELHWKNNYTIDPEGRIYKCPAVAGRPEMAVASVQSPAPEKVAPLVASRPWEQCGSCPYLSVCAGGCLGGRYLRTGRTDEVACKKEWFEAAFRESIVTRYLAEFGDTTAA